MIRRKANIDYEVILVMCANDSVGKEASSKAMS